MISQLHNLVFLLFPAAAGMNRKRPIEWFPAAAGMNRLAEADDEIERPVPRSRGDEPIIGGLVSLAGICSPQPRG